MSDENMNEGQEPASADDAPAAPPEATPEPEPVAQETAPLPSGPPVPANTNVALLVSKGAADAAQAAVATPDVFNATQADALEKLQGAGFDVEILRNASSTVDAGNVAQQLPAAGAQATRGSKAAIVVSTGVAAEDAAMTVLPDMVGKPKDDARSLATQTQLKASVLEDFSATVPAGVVYGQEPNAKSLNRAPEKKGGLAWLWILLLLLIVGGLAYWAFFMDKPQVEAPNIVGMEVDAAETTLDEAGLALGRVTETATADVMAGEIVEQTPEAGVEANEGSRVDVIVARAPEGVEVPDVVGSRVASAKNTLDGAGLTSRVDEVYSDDVGEGRVVAQSPEPGTRVEEGAQVALSVSMGPEPAPNVSVPNVSGMSEADAETALEDAGLRSRSVKTYSDAVPEGDVIAQAPASGSSVAPDTQILLFVSDGPVPPDVEDVVVPNVDGMMQDDAEDALEDVGFSVEIIEMPNADVEEGIVFQQFPLAGEEIPEGSSVAIFVSTGPQM